MIKFAAVGKDGVPEQLLQSETSATGYRTGTRRVGFNSIKI